MIKAMLDIRLIHLKYSLLHVLFWLLFPLMMTGLISFTLTQATNDTKIPIAVINDDDSELASDLYDSMSNTKYIRMVEATEAEALKKLKTNELDAVFIIKKGYGAQIEKGGRNRLVEAYESDLSFAFVLLTETITSFIQQDAGRSKAFYELSRLNQQFGHEINLDLPAYIELQKQKEAEQNLLTTSLVYSDTKEFNDEIIPFVNSLSIWMISAFLAVFMLLDWVIKENSVAIRQRFIFTKINYHVYLFAQLIIYTLLNLVIDIISLLILGMTINSAFFISLIAFRIIINLFVFLIAYQFKQTYPYYALGIASVLIAVVLSGLFIPINYSFIDLINPFYALNEGRVAYVSLSLICLAFIFWLVKRR